MKCRELDPRMARRHGAQLLAGVRRGLDLPEAQWPQPPVQPDERALGKARIQALSALIHARAEARRLDPRLVASKADVMQLLADGPEASPERHRLLRGWRAELLGDAWRAI
jgi:ribonuclease D